MLPRTVTCVYNGVIVTSLDIDRAGLKRFRNASYLLVVGTFENFDFVLPSGIVYWLWRITRKFIREILWNQFPCEIFWLFSTVQVLIMIHIACAFLDRWPAATEHCVVNIPEEWEDVILLHRLKYSLSHISAIIFDNGDHDYHWNNPAEVWRQRSIVCVFYSRNIPGRKQNERWIQTNVFIPTFFLVKPRLS